MKFSAEWDDQFGKREPGNNAIFLMAGEACLGYVHSCANTENRYMACVGAGINAPVVKMGNDLDECKEAVELHYAAHDERKEK